jgi:hypothetical protein
MSYRLVTLAEVKRQLVYDNALSDAALTFRLEAVSGVIVDFIGEHSEQWAEGWTDSSGEPLVDDDGNPLVLVLVVDSNGDAILDSNGDRQYDVEVAEIDSAGDYSNGVSVVPQQVQAAVICAMSAWDEQRGADIITPAVKSLLQRTRRPVVV